MMEILSAGGGGFIIIIIIFISARRHDDYQLLNVVYILETMESFDDDCNSEER